jgi:energy-coupling factor transport system ATP-binding protein
MVPMIELRDISFGYSGAESKALARVNLQFDAGEFSLVCGATGSGKSTLLRILNGLAPHFTGGELSGSLIVDDLDCTGFLPHDLATKIGFVNQQPESSFVSDLVREELAFGMEQLGFAQSEMIQGIERIAKLLEIEELLDRPLSWLSGGQQQRVAIASALAAGQKILLLDEPTSALDPAAASEIVKTLERLAHQHGITVILVEHRIERVIELVDSIVVVGNDGLVTKGGMEQFENYHLVPPVIALAQKLNWRPVPLGVNDASKMWRSSPARVSARTREVNQNPVSISASGISVRYGETQAVKEVSFTAASGELVAIMGENGSGKSSLLWALQGSGSRSEGKVSTPFGDPKEFSSAERLCVITLVPQKAADLLFLNSLADELEESDKFAGSMEPATSKIFEQLAGRLDPKLHPRDLSAGQQLALVLSLQLVKGAGVILLDEPTRGLDYAAKKSLVVQLKKLAAEGKTVILATHDVEFAAQVATRVLTLSGGRLVSEDSVEVALGSDSENPTQLAQVTQIKDVLTLEDVSP